jgi:alpha-glucosidase
MTDTAAIEPGLHVSPALGDRAAWWRTGPIYHIYPRSFRDSNGDGIGDLRGIIEKLDYLNDGTSSSLGVKAIWLPPIYLSPGDFDALVEECHKREIRVVLDLVLTHTSDAHPWFVESRSSR